jgi:hypothetical protein
MSCPHCQATVPPHRFGSTGGQCPRCLGLFVTDERVHHDSFSAGFLEERVAEISRGGELRFTALQLQHDVRRLRPYPRLPRRPFRERLRSDAGRSFGVSDAAGCALGILAAIGLFTALTAVITTYVEPWTTGRWFEAPVDVAIGLLSLVLWGVPVLAFAVGRRIASFFVVLVDEVRWLAASLRHDQHGRMMRPSTFTAHVLATWEREHGGAPPGLVVEHGMVPPPPPEQVRFAVLCPDPAAAAGLWANDVAGTLGALVVTSAADLPDGVPVIELSDASPDVEPAALVGRLLRESPDLLRVRSSGFLTGPVSA